MSETDAFEFRPIRVSTLRGDQEIPFDAHVKVNDRFVLYTRKGDSFEGTRLERLRKKNLINLWIKFDQMNSYVEYVKSNLDRAYDPNVELELEVRCHIIQGSIMAAIEDCFESHENPLYHRILHDALRSLRTFLIENDQAIVHFLKMNNPGFSISHHGVSTAALSFCICEHLKVANEEEQIHLAMGCCLHDREHFFNESPFLDRNPEDFSREDYAEYIRHSEECYLALKEDGHFDPLTLEVIRLHEGGLNDHAGRVPLDEKTTSDEIWIAIAANAYDHMLSFEKTPTEELIRKFYFRNTGNIPVKHLEAITWVHKKL